MISALSDTTQMNDEQRIRLCLKAYWRAQKAESKVCFMASIFDIILLSHDKTVTEALGYTDSLHACFLDLLRDLNDETLFERRRVFCSLQQSTQKNTEKSLCSLTLKENENENEFQLSEHSKELVSFFLIHIIGLLFSMWVAMSRVLKRNQRLQQPLQQPLSLTIKPETAFIESMTS